MSYLSSSRGDPVKSELTSKHIMPMYLIHEEQYYDFKCVDIKICLHGFDSHSSHKQGRSVAREFVASERIVGKSLGTQTGHLYVKAFVLPRSAISADDSSLRQGQNKCFDTVNRAQLNLMALFSDLFSCIRLTFSKSLNVPFML